MRVWTLVTDVRPDSGDLPVTVVRSKERNLAYFTRYIPEGEMDQEAKDSVSKYFNEGEMVTGENWYPPLA